jgi:hypothetical protein
LRRRGGQCGVPGRGSELLCVPPEEASPPPLVLGEPEECKYEYEYEVWIVVQVLHQPPEIGGQGNRQDLAEFLLEQLRESVADVLADRVEGTVWKSAALPRQQALALVADLPDVLREGVAMPLEKLADAAGTPGPAAAFGADVAVSFVTEAIDSRRSHPGAGWCHHRRGYGAASPGGPVRRALAP